MPTLPDIDRAGRMRVSDALIIAIISVLAVAAVKILGERSVPGFQQVSRFL